MKILWHPDEERERRRSRKTRKVPLNGDRIVVRKMPFACSDRPQSGNSYGGHVNRSVLRSIMLTIMGTVLVGAMASQPANAAGLNIGVAPSPNGYVMRDVPTQVAVSGASRAVVYIFNPTIGKYTRVGTATAKSAVPFTFTTNGLQKIKVVPSSGRSKVFKVPVYARVSGRGNTPTNYGGLILPSDNYAFGPMTAKASEGCVLVDVGGKGYYDRTPPFTITVSSSGANPAVIQVPGGTGGAGQANVRVAGDVVIQPSDNGKQGESIYGAMFTCLNPE